MVPIEDLATLEALEAAEDEHWSRVAYEAIVEWETAGRPADIRLRIARDLGIDLTADPDALP